MYHVFGSNGHKLLISTPDRAEAMRVCQNYQDGTYTSYILAGGGNGHAAKQVGNSVDGWTDSTPTVIEAMKNAIEFLEANGYGDGGDIHDDLVIAARLVGRNHSVAQEVLR
jgi:hypothetical protein